VKRPNQIFVANHTTIFDIAVLQQHFCFSVVGQKHPGLMGIYYCEFITIVTHDIRIFPGLSAELFGVSVVQQK
jgi:hypothetical protein